MEFLECTRPHLEADHVSLPMEELLELRATHARVAAAERREAEAVADRRAAELRASQAEERAARAEHERAATLASVAAAHGEHAKQVAEAVAQERQAALAYRTDSKGGLIDENAALGRTVTRLLAENEMLTTRVAAALDALDAERKEHAKLKASRPDVQIEAEKSAADLEKAKVEASVRTKEIESNHDLATMLLTGLGTALLPMSEKVLAKVLEEKFPRTLQAGTGAGVPPQTKPEGGKPPLQVWTELLAECWLALSPTSRMQAAFALAESRWLNVLLVPDTHPIFARMRDEIGVEKVTKLAQMTYALTGISPVATDNTKPEQPAEMKANGAPPQPAGAATA
jgi:hypothetical protein